MNRPDVEGRRLAGLLPRPPSAAALAWGVVAALAIWAAAVAAGLATPWFGLTAAARLDSVSLGNGYAFRIEASHSHPFLAEYRQRLELFDDSLGRPIRLATIALPANTGGGVRIGVVVPRDPARQELLLIDHVFSSRIDLARRQRIAGVADWSQPGMRSLGWVVGDSRGLIFVPCAVWETVPVATQERILGGSPQLATFCQARP